ncbi:hypothetical protein HMPREF1576_01163 [Gardnerella pickettii JCP7719]|uniref:Uncharacterized protein n=1 Tax=Gardnerella pickettii JCP7719 TaxID=1261061 RepID=S4GW58_9BIFI|nr:hypothetical protein HMPREF1576_01163 [Gardnerella pickettii JCP7719]
MTVSRGVCVSSTLTDSCGVLVDWAENSFLIPVKAMRDERTLYRYLPQVALSLLSGGQ